MKRMAWMFLFIFTLSTLSGCGEISKAQYEALSQEYSVAAARLKEAYANLEASENAREMEAEAGVKKTPAPQADLDTARQENAKLKSDITALEAKVKDLEWKKLTLELKLDPKKKKEMEKENEQKDAQKNAENASDVKA